MQVTCGILALFSFYFLVPWDGLPTGVCPGKKWSSFRNLVINPHFPIFPRLAVGCYAGSDAETSRELWWDARVTAITPTSCTGLCWQKSML